MLSLCHRLCFLQGKLNPFAKNDKASGDSDSLDTANPASGDNPLDGVKNKLGGMFGGSGDTLEGTKTNRTGFWAVSWAKNDTGKTGHEDSVVMSGYYFRLYVIHKENYYGFLCKLWNINGRWRKVLPILRNLGGGYGGRSPL